MFHYCKSKIKNAILHLYGLLFIWQLGHGDFSAANTRVLRMVNTLGVENEAKQTIEALQAELQKTKERLQAVEESKSQSGKFRIF